MTGYTLSDEAEKQLQEIVDYTHRRWSEEQAIRYFDGFLAQFQAIVSQRVRRKPVPASFGVEGWLCRYGRHFIYWTTASDNSVRIVTILHERMQQRASLKDDPEA